MMVAADQTKQEFVETAESPMNDVVFPSTEGTNHSKDEAFKVEIAKHLRRRQRKLTFIITITALCLTIVFILLAFLISVGEKARDATHGRSQASCTDNCTIKLAETIPSGVTFPSAVVHPPIVHELKQLLLSAKKSVDIASSYWTLRASDVKGGPYPMASVGQEIFDELVNAASKRGVRIRIVHQVFCKNGKCSYPTNDTDELAKIKNIEIRTLDVQKLLGAGIIHTKMWLVDGRQIYLGSANMDWRSYTEVKELALITRECACLAADMQKIYDAYWGLALPNAKVPKVWPKSFNTMFNKDNPLQISHNNLTTRVFLGSSPPQFCPSNRTSDIGAILHTIQSANKFVFVAVMDYITAVIYTKQKRYWGVIDSALRSAAYDRGIEVKVLASNWSHIKPEMVFMLKSLQDFGKASKRGSIQVRMFSVPDGSVKIPFTRVNHNKYMVTDTTAYVGTSNWVGDYFISTAGIGYTVQQDDADSSAVTIQQQLRDVFKRDWDSKYASVIK